MAPDPPPTSALVLLLTVIAGLAICAVAAAIMVPAMLGAVGAWPALVAGSLVLVATLTALFLLHRRRDRSLW